MDTSFEVITVAIIITCLLPFFSTVSSQTGCVDTFNISSGGTILTVEGGVQTCFRCLFDGAVNPSTMWTLKSVLISPSDGTVTNGVLTIFDPATVVPSVSPTTQLFCIAGSQYMVFLRIRGRLGRIKLCSSWFLGLRVFVLLYETCTELRTVSNNTANAWEQVHVHLLVLCPDPVQKY